MYNMKYFLNILAVLFLFSLSTKAENNVDIKAKADSAFVHEKFDKAASLYNKLPGKESSVQICYNLGCCYYRLDNMAKCLLWLERASLLDPGDDDVRFNLEMARTKTIDKIVPQHEFILFTAYRTLVNIMSLQSWAYVCIVLFALSLLAFALFFFSDVIVLRKVGFFSAFLFALLCIIGNVCAFQQRSFAINRNSGIIMSPAVTVKSTPSDNGNDLFVIHEGTRVEITDSSLKEWCEVKIADGKIGWIRKKTFEII